MSATRVTVVILAGGRSSRFGRDKLAEPIDGRPLLHHVIDAVRPIAVEIVVVAAPGATPPVPAGVRVVHDPVAFEGPLAAARVGIDAASESIVVLVGGDMPSLVAPVLGSMVVGLGGFDAVVLEHVGHPRPLPRVVRREPALVAAGRLLDHGERRLRALADALNSHVIAEATWRALDPEGATLRDIDTEADLA
ncbi:MAG: molybdenum cofactor guanylyltransferase, partial [Ilumatobacteraceae bacterium]